jgi:hypothetical protein
MTTSFSTAMTSIWKRRAAHHAHAMPRAAIARPRAALRGARDSAPQGNVVKVYTLDSEQEKASAEKPAAEEAEEAEVEGRTPEANANACPGCRCIVL